MEFQQLVVKLLPEAVREGLPVVEFLKPEEWWSKLELVPDLALD